MTEDAEAKLLEEAVETSYQKGGKAVSLRESVSKQTVKNKVHKLRFPSVQEECTEKKKVRILHINADEDHVAAQFYKEKGDTKKADGKKYHTFMPKLVYVYESLIPESISPNVYRTRYKLENPHFFGGMYGGHDNAMLWKEVQSYIENHYDWECLEKIYISGDGASWIKAGCTYVDKSVFVLDKFHKNKYINDSVSHMLDSKGDAWDMIEDSFSREDKRGFHHIYNQLVEYAETESKKETIESARTYLKNNWGGIVIYNQERCDIKGCNAEGHVSHVYASRMSSRPLGWSKTGADKMSRLRVYYYNGGNMLDLVRMQKDELRLAAGAEELSCGDILKSECGKSGELGKYMETMTHKLLFCQVKRRSKYKAHIWGL